MVHYKPDLYQDWKEFCNKQKHLPDSFFNQFIYHSKEDAYKNLTGEIITRYGTDKINWLYVSIYTPLNEHLVEKYKHLLNMHYVNERLKL